MRVLVACEFSGIVRDAFLKKGHDAWSCDNLFTPCGQTSLGMRCSCHHHIYDDVLKHLRGGWDMMIAFPPCTHLAVSGARWFKYKIKEQQKAIWFFSELVHAPIPRICIENPIGIMSSVYRKPDQIIQPWQFGHGETKATCLWLKNLKLLKPTNIVEGRKPRIHMMSPSKDRGKLRSITYRGIADAMADQWG